MSLRRWGINTIEFIDQPGSQTADSAFSQKVRELSRSDLDRCYQCLTCSLGCPVAFAMDYRPNQVMRMVQLGQKQKLLESSTIWICAGCETCVTRCPNEVNILGVMDTLREMALREKVEGKEKVIPTFHQTFLYPVEKLGKQYELGMLLLLKLRTKDFFSDLGLGMKMFARRKLKLFPSKIKASKEMKTIFEKTRGV
ncbi:MAG: 4Fe-4S dicluster domain-containing protein [Dehalococcoidia bacterium]|nr:4Fe-4S dicluster domain-containing protein [Dehalococcoidia bacterium]